MENQFSTQCGPDFAEESYLQSMEAKQKIKERAKEEADRLFQSSSKFRELTCVMMKAIEDGNFSVAVNTELVREDKRFLQLLKLLGYKCTESTSGSLTFIDWSMAE